MSGDTKPTTCEEKRLRGSTAWQKKNKETAVPIGTAIETFLSDRDRQFSRAGMIAGAWEQVVPDTMRAHCSLAGFDGGVLTVEVCAGPFLYQLQMIRGRLLEEMRARCPRCGLKEIRILPGIIHTQKDTL
jgi:hypothetical protein